MRPDWYKWVKLTPWGCNTDCEYTEQIESSPNFIFRKLPVTVTFFAIPVPDSKKKKKKKIGARGAMCEKDWTSSRGNDNCNVENTCQKDYFGK